jgi:hypothetical protein
MANDLSETPYDPALDNPADFDFDPEFHAACDGQRYTDFYIAFREAHEVPDPPDIDADGYDDEDHCTNANRSWRDTDYLSLNEDHDN